MVVVVVAAAAKRRKREVVTVVTLQKKQCSDHAILTLPVTQIHLLKKPEIIAIAIKVFGNLLERKL